MKVDPEVFLRLTESAQTIGFIDIESTGLKGDYNTVLVVSVRPFGSAPVSYSVRRPGDDRRVVQDAKSALERLDCWVTYYGKGFDIKMLNTRLLHYGIGPIGKRPHIDMFYTLKANLLTGRRSQGHLLSWLKLPEQKMSVSADDWASALKDWKRIKPTMIARCESDVQGLEALYRRTKHLIKEIKT